MTAPPPPSVADALGNAGPCPQIEWNGRTYTVGHPCPEAVAHAERLAAKLAWDSLGEVRGVLDADAFAELKAQTAADIQARKWAFGQPLFTAALAGPDGNALVLYACLRLHHPDITVEQVRAMARDADGASELALLQVSGGFFSAAAQTLPLGAADRAAVGAEMALRVTAEMVRRRAARTASASSPPTSAPTPA